MADDEAAIKEVIESAYVQGLWVKRDPDLMREGFAPNFVMQIYSKGKHSSTTLDEWLDRMKLDKVPNKKAIKADISVVSHEGDAAIARVELYIDGKLTYTDFFGLYRADSWQIVTKHFHSHG
ncbi:MAG: nuclear transport factor 2 family protein [Acidobacteriota bacterium]